MHADGKSTLASVSKWKSGKVNCSRTNRKLKGLRLASQYRCGICVYNYPFPECSCHPCFQRKYQMITIIKMIFLITFETFYK